MSIIISIYKEKKKKNFRMIIVPTGLDKYGITNHRDYAIISYLDRDEAEKIGELVLWALKESHEKLTKINTEIKYEKKFSNSSSYRKFTTEYNLMSFYYHEDKYYLSLRAKDGAGFGPFEDENSEYEFGEKKPAPLELGLKVLEMFEYKEEYDEI